MSDDAYKRVEHGPLRRASRAGARWKDAVRESAEAAQKEGRDAQEWLREYPVIIGDANLGMQMADLYQASHIMGQSAVYSLALESTLPDICASAWLDGFVTGAIYMQGRSGSDEQ